MGPAFAKERAFLPLIPSPAPSISGPTAGFAELFVNRWCILTPPERHRSEASRSYRILAAYWRER